MKWRGNRNSKVIGALLPLMVVMVAFVVGGVGMAIGESIGFTPFATTERPSWEAYRLVLFSEWFLNSVYFTLWIASMSTGISIVLAVAVTFWLVDIRSGWWQRLLLIPLGIPHVVGAVAIVLLASQTGWFSRWAYALGWIEEWQQMPIVTNDPAGWGIILAYVWKETPFLILFWLPVVHRVRTEWMHVARVYGATARQALWHVVWPLSWPMMAVGSLIVFAFIFGALDVPYVLGVTYPQALPVVAYELYQGSWEHRPQAMVVALIQTAIIVVAGGIWVIALRNKRRHLGW